ncbi:chemokine (C motif) receptor 1a, duplicate 1 isoform X1 [Halichoeres trimaculatus]|uniref:chemokine (C motif) receptor 1a, duplicate 1 isoform X1 n=1 Tax=Halichoeres trimaculatus TaxID=147232 RepID=UPI003D9F6087
MNDSVNNSLEYDYFYEDGVCEKYQVVKVGSYAVPIFFSIVITLSLTGNILVLVILGLYEDLKSLTNIFILNLAISDLIFTTGLPFWAIYHIWGWLFSETLCKMVSFVFFTGFFSSILFLTGMTIYRYLSVVHPLLCIKTKSFSTGFFVSFLLWMISIGAAMPSLLYSSVVLVPHRDGHSLGCEYETHQLKNIAVIQQNVFFLFAFAVIALCYIRILGRIMKARSNTKNRAIKLVFCIVAVFFLGWVPYNVVIFLRILSENLVEPFHECDTSIQLDYAYFVCRFIAFSHCCLNPVFYALVGVKFRSHLKSILHRMRICRITVEEQQATVRTFSRGSMY